MATPPLTIHLQIGSADENGRYPISVINSPNNRKTRKPVWQEMPWDEVQHLVSYYQSLLVDGKQVRKLGKTLSRFLLPTRIKKLFRAAQTIADSAGRPLHVRLEITPTALQSLPWELLYDTKAKNYWTTGRTVTLTRYSPVSKAQRPLWINTPLKILLVTAAPDDLPPFEQDKTAVRIQRALAPLKDDIELTTINDATPEFLHQSLLTIQPDVLHIVGHGNQEGLALTNAETGLSQTVDVEQMRALLDGSSVKVAIFAACDSANFSQQATSLPFLNMVQAATLANVPAVIGMQTPMPIRAMQKFNQTLYMALVHSLPLDQAVGEARINLFTTATDKLFWSIPVLALRSTDGVIWHQPELVLPKVTPALQPYLEMMVRRNGRLPLGAIDPIGHDSNQISLGQVFIHLDADVSVQVERPLGRPVIVRQTQTIGHAYTNRQLILLGDPGSGKSTLLRYLAFCFANAILRQDESWLSYISWTEDYLETRDDLLQDLLTMLTRENLDFQQQAARWRGHIPIPIFVELRNLARQFATDGLGEGAPSLTLWAYVKSQLAAQGLEDALPELERLGQNGRLIFLLDGVDEVPIAERKLIWDIIKGLNRGVMGGNRWITTCRILSFSGQEAPASVASRTLQSLNNAQIAHFIDSWYRALEEAGELNRRQASVMTQTLQQATQRPQLQTLAENPMLLTIMTLVQTYHGTLPEERAKLYQACVETLLLRWQRHKEDSSGPQMPNVLAQLGIGQQDLERLLWEIAWTAHMDTEDRETAADIPEMELLQIAKEYLGSFAKAEQFLEYTEERAHLLIGRGGRRKRVYTFPHRTFEEYLAACYLASQRRYPVMAANLAKEKDAWREVLNLSAGTLVYNQNNYEAVIDAVKETMPGKTPTVTSRTGWYRVWLAAEMMVTVGQQAAEKDEVGRKILPKLREQLVALLASGVLTPLQRSEAGEALGLLGDPRAGVTTLEPIMLTIPAGKVNYTNDANEPQTTQLDPFAIAQYPVTNAQYRFFVDANGYQTPSYWSRSGKAWLKKQGAEARQAIFQDSALIGNYPVVGVSLYEAEAYCAWLSGRLKRPFRLPTDLEWYRAADIDPLDLKVGLTLYQVPTMAVGAFPQTVTTFGLHDMIGNAMEWSISQTDGKGVVWGRLWDLHIEGDYLIDLTHNLIE
ncbi:MAG: SUMF1/EgtB/PvdO family nonheme iron enzyme, partial [Chloroflexota bacterium]